MGKRSSIPRSRSDYHPTPREAVVPLVPYLPKALTTWWEPCAGDGRLVEHLRDLWPYGVCFRPSDIEPRADWIIPLDAFAVLATDQQMIITNPPWPVVGGRGEPALGLVKHLAGLAPTWLLLPWAFAANTYFAQVHSICVRIVPIGRVSWAGNGVPGKDDAAWFLFDAKHNGGPKIEARQ